MSRMTHVFPDNTLTKTRVRKSFAPVNRTDGGAGAIADARRRMTRAAAAAFGDAFRRREAPGSGTRRARTAKSVDEAMSDANER